MMSKSAGNGIRNPLAADRALRRRCPRFALCAGGGGAARTSASTTTAAPAVSAHGGGARNFANKLWKTPPARADEPGRRNARPPSAPRSCGASPCADRWILSRPGPASNQTPPSAMPATGLERSGQGGSTSRLGMRMLRRTIRSLAQAPPQIPVPPTEGARAQPWRPRDQRVARQVLAQGARRG